METNVYTPKPKTSVSTYIALGSFVIGTILLLLELTSPNEIRLLLFGLCYVVLAFLVNSIVLLRLCYQFIITPKEREIIAIRILILLSNVPIAALYTYLALSQYTNL